MPASRSVEFTGIHFENPFLLSSAPPTESESNILRAFEAGWGGVVTKTIGLHPVVNVVGAKAKFMRTSPEDANVSMKKRPGAALHSSWNWELISDKALDWWLPRIRRIKEAFPDRVLIGSIMAGSGNDKELKNWQRLARDCQDAGVDGLELNFSCPAHGPPRHGVEHREGPGALLGGHGSGQGGRARSGLVQAHSGHRGNRDRGGGVFPGRSRRDRLLQHLPFPPGDRSRDARVRDQRRRSGLERRTRRPRDPPALARQDVSDDPRVSRQELLGNRGCLGFCAGALLHPPGMRHGAGVYRGHARPGGRAQA